MGRATIGLMHGRCKARCNGSNAGHYSNDTPRPLYFLPPSPADLFSNLPPPYQCGDKTGKEKGRDLVLGTGNVYISINGTH